MTDPTTKPRHVALVTESIEIPDTAPLPRPVRVRDVMPLFDESWSQVRMVRTAHGERQWTRFLRARRRSRRHGTLS